jgi:acetoin:2,6-dichlorophenolindophenol oxidoreductase subunit alpha
MRMRCERFIAHDTYKRRPSLGARTPMPAALPNDVAWEILERMLLIRRFEEAVLKLSYEKQFVGHYHLYIGQEATGAAAMSVLEKRDYLATTHRNHGHVIARGADPGRAMAEILGRATGLNGGRGGTIHLSEPDLGFISTSGIVGGCIAIGTGAGFACRQRKNGAVSAVFFGDGALEEGVSFEALNIASLWKLPVLFLCENNSAGSWAPGEGYPTLVHASTDLCSIAQSVNIPTVRIDGADAAAAYVALTDAVAHCRAGKGPIFIEAVTKRWPGNNPLWPEPVTGATDIAMATEERRPAGEHAEWLENHDPVLRLGRALAKDVDSIKRLRLLDEQKRRQIEAAVEFAKHSPLPQATTAYDHVFA